MTHDIIQVAEDRKACIYIAAFTTSDQRPANEIVFETSSLLSGRKHGSHFVHSKLPHTAMC